jgi:hypothetical protein
MTQNVLHIGLEVLGIGVGALILGLFAWGIAIHQRVRVHPGSSGHRAEEEREGEHESVGPDGYIDSFNNTIEEAGGSLPLVVQLAFIGIWLWWLLYLILNWKPR